MICVLVDAGAAGREFFVLPVHEPNGVRFLEVAPIIGPEDLFQEAFAESEWLPEFTQAACDCMIVRRMLRGQR